MWIVVGIILAIAGIAYLGHRANVKRRKALLAKYGDPRVVEAIMSKTIWQGQTIEQLVDSLGRPVDVDRKVYKTKTKETWKYNQTGRNRFGLRIIVENDEVVGWDKK